MKKERNPSINLSKCIFFIHLIQFVSTKLRIFLPVRQAAGKCDRSSLLNDQAIKLIFHIISLCYELYFNREYLWHVHCSYLEGKINVKGVIIMQTDPVCGMQVDKKSAAANRSKSCRQG